MMSDALTLAGWALLLLAGIACMQWGSQRVCAALGMVQRAWGLADSAGGALVGIATASPEISVNIVSVVLGWPDIGLGTALGSNVPAIPLILIVAYLSRRTQRSTWAPEVPRAKPQAAWVQALPYALVVALVAALTLPPRWSGLQPVDSLFLLAAFGLWLGQALLRHRDPAARSPIAWRRLGWAALGLGAIAVGAVASVIGVRHINQALGISDLVGGLFIVGLLCALPESLTAWRLTRKGETTAAVSGAFADGIVSLTLAFLPLALLGTPIGDVGLYVANLAFIGVALLLYMGLSGVARGTELTGPRVAAFGCAYGAYVAVVVVLTQ